MAKHQRISRQNRQPIGGVTTPPAEQFVGAVFAEIARAERKLQPRVPAPPKHKRMTRKQARSWLAPMRQAMAQIKTGEVDSVMGYAVTRLHDQDDYARLDFCINGFTGLIHRLNLGLDISPAERLSKRLAAGVPLTVAEVDNVLAILNQVEDKLVGMPIDIVKDAVRTEEINIELEVLGLKEAV